MKLLTIGISASTHQIGLLEELWISIRPLIERVSVILDLLEVPGITSRDYLERLARVTCGSKIRIRTRKSGSLGASRNYVLKNAETPYVMFLDGDDFLDASNLAYVLDVLSVPGPAVDIGVFAGRLYERGHSASWLTNLLPSHPLKSVDQWMSWFEAMPWTGLLPRILRL
jgi:glycosyltransferase involved in cell wall biosynthesis